MQTRVEERRVKCDSGRKWCAPTCHGPTPHYIGKRANIVFVKGSIPTSASPISVTGRFSSFRSCQHLRSVRVVGRPFGPQRRVSRTVTFVFCRRACFQILCFCLRMFRFRPEGWKALPMSAPQQCHGQDAVR